jgi:hypothetical protein
MKSSARSSMGASLLALTGLMGWGASTAQAQVGYYVVPIPAYPQYYTYSYSIPYTAPAQTYVYTRPSVRRTPPNPGIGGNGYHYGYYPARRELPLYKPWLRRD